MVWLFAATAPEEGGEGRGREAKRQELAPIAIVNPLLAHRDILGLGSHKKVHKKLKLKPPRRIQGRRVEVNRENILYTCTGLTTSQTLGGTDLARLG